LRRQLLVLLKDYGGPAYREIARLPEFSGEKMTCSLLFLVHIRVELLQEKIMIYAKMQAPSPI